MDNAAIARALADIADLLEIKGENAFKIRAYRSAADVVQTSGEPVAGMTDAQLRALPGIGKDLSARIRELADTGTCAPYRELMAAFPATILDLLRLQGVGPKTVALLYHSLGVDSVEALSAAAQAGRLRTLKGMGPKKESLILKAIDDRTRTAGRHLLADAAALAEDIITSLVAAHPAASILPVGSLRRGVETCGDVDLLCTGADRSVMDTFVTHPRVEQVLGRGDTKSSVRVRSGVQVDLRVVPSAEPRRGDAVFHRLQGPQHRAAGPGTAARHDAERVRAHAARRRPGGGQRDRRGHLPRARPVVDCPGAA